MWRRTLSAMVTAKLRVMRKTAAMCSGCYRLALPPMYRCSSPDKHSGDRGGLWRSGLPMFALHRERCPCGALLAGDVYRASRALTPACPRCGTVLYSGAGSMHDTRFVAFGSSHVEMLRSGLRHLRESHADTTSLTLVRAVKGRPAIYRLRLDSSWVPVMAHLLSMTDISLASDPSMAKYVSVARGFIYTFNADEWLSQRVRSTQPSDDYNRLAASLRNRQVDSRRLPLAVVIYNLPQNPQLSRDSRAIQGWLGGQGLGNLVRSADRDFGKVQWFTVAENDGAAAYAPLKWLLSCEGVSL